MNQPILTNSIRGETITNYHGVDIADPYRIFENPNHKNTIEWTDCQNNKTSQFLDSTQIREFARQKLTDYVNFPKFSLLYKNDTYYYYYKNTGLQNQAVLYRAKDLDGKQEEVIFDPNILEEDGTAAISTISFNNDGTEMVYGISYSGSDWQEMKIKNLETGEDYPEVLKWSKFTTIAWDENNEGFFYNRFPILDSPLLDVPNYNKVYWHKLGTSQEEDKLIYEDPSQKEISFSPFMSSDKKYLILKINFGTEPKTRIFYCKLDNQNLFFPLINDGEYNYSYIGNKGDLFYFHTNYKAPKGRILAVNIKHPHKDHWLEIIPECEDTIAEVRHSNNQFIISYLHQAYHRLKIFDLDGTNSKEIPLPIHVSIGNIVLDQSDLYFSYSSYLIPPTSVKYNYETEKLEIIFEGKHHVDTNLYETKQIHYKCNDGTKVPMFLTYKKGIILDGNNPVLLFGYGGYNLSQTPNFNSSHLLWLETGGIYAVANIRGGNEFGEDWHTAGILEKKQNVFDDFISAAEWLIEKKYTNEKKLAIMGRSNGGLLVAACITQRPDLFGAGLCLVPVTDMLRFHLYTSGRPWTTEFGNAEVNPKHFDFMIKYSPLHNVKEGIEYPPMLITTGDTDDRVVPFHAKKFAATLQDVQSGKNPILLRVESKAGHGHGKPVSKVVNEDADLLTFLFHELNINVPK